MTADLIMEVADIEVRIFIFIKVNEIDTSYSSTFKVANRKYIPKDFLMSVTTVIEKDMCLYSLFAM